MPTCSAVISHNPFIACPEPATHALYWDETDQRGTRVLHERREVCTEHLNGLAAALERDLTVSNIIAKEIKR